MPFSNPLVAGNTLIRESIESEGFQTGIQGWSIQRDGDAEFNDVSIRGELSVSGSDTTEISIDTDPTNNNAQIMFDILGGAIQYVMKVWASDEILGGGSWSLFTVDSPQIAPIFVMSQAYELMFFGQTLQNSQGVYVTDDGYIKAGQMNNLPQLDEWREVGGGGNPNFINLFGNLGGGFNTVAFKRMPDGTVLLKGTANRAGGTADGTTIFTLPVGYRPPATALLPAGNGSGVTAVAVDTGPAVRVLANGNVNVYGFGTLAGNTNIGLDGVRFSII